MTVMFELVDQTVLFELPGADLLGPYALAAQDALDRINEFTTGPAGPSNNTRINLAALKSAATTDRTSLYDGSLWSWETANAPYTADDVSVVKADSTALSVGAWVRQKASGISFRGTGTGEVTTDTAALLNAAVDVRRFGAKCDGTTDDTAAVQAALDYCTLGSSHNGSYAPDVIGALAYPRALVVPGMCRITGSLIIKNRRVDRTLGRFAVVGLGSGGFVIGGNFTLFTSDETSDPAAPNAEMLVFQGLRFLSHVSNNTAYTHSGQFLRVWFEQCEWWRVACVNTTRYAQEWSFFHCMVRALSNGRAFFTAAGGYVIRSSRNKFQNFDGGALGVFQLHDQLGNSGAIGCSFESDTYESSFGPYLRASICQGLTVTGLYTENNSGPLIDLRCLPGGKNSGVSIAGNEFHANTANQNDTNFYQVVWGPGGGASSGNTSRGGLHDNLLRSMGGLVAGCDLQELRADDRVIGSGKLYAVEVDVQNGLTPSSTEARPGTLFTARAVTVTAVNSATHTASLPAPLPGMTITLMNRTSLGFSLFPSPIVDGAKFYSGSANLPLTFPALTRRTFSCTEAGIWDF